MNIIELAKQAGLHIATDVNWMPIIGLEYAEKLIALTRADERKACADICIKMANRCDDIRKAALEVAAENIMAKGTT
jgi:hypothetical protein